MNTETTEKKETGGFTAPVARSRDYENPPASKEIKDKLKMGLMEVYYELCHELDKLARAKQPMPTEMKVSAEINLL